MIALNPTVVVAAIAAGCICSIMIAVRFRSIMIAIAGMMFVAAIGVTKSKTGAIHGSWLLPVQALRAEIFFAGGLLVLLGVLIHRPSVPLHRTSGQAWMIVALALYQGLMRELHDGGIEGFKTISGVILTVLPLILAVSALLRTQRDWHALARLFMWVNVAWIGGVFVQLVLDPSRLTYGWESRFVGLGGNAQHAAAIISIFTFLSLWLALNDDRIRFRGLFIGVFAINLVMLLGTGSRTGALMFMLGASAILYRRWGRFVLLLPLAAVALWGVYRMIIVAGIDLGTERVTSLQDTRSAAWLALIDQAMESPLVGNGMEDTVHSENSFLWGFAAYGAGFLALCVAFLLMSVVHCLSLLRASVHLPQWRPVVDLAIGFNMMYFAGAMFEGYILLRATIPLCGMVLIGSMSAIMLQAYRSDTIDLLEDDAMETDDEWEFDQDYDVADDEQLSYGTGYGDGGG